MPPEVQAEELKLRASLYALRKEQREAGIRQTYSAAKLDYAPFQGLKRGPKPDPNRECTEVVLTSRVTKREAKELRRHQRKLCKDSSPSSFMRFVLCQWLEAHRDKKADPEAFSFNPNDLDWRTKKHRRDEQ